MTSAEYFSTYAKRYAMLGAAAIGGCCGITPSHIRELARTIKPLMRAEKQELPKLEVADCDLLNPVPLAERSSFGAKLAAGKFVTSVEITPPRGFDLASTVAGARKCLEAGVDAVNLPDGPRASARISPFAAAVAIQREVGIETVLHCCGRDKSMRELPPETAGNVDAVTLFDLLEHIEDDREFLRSLSDDAAPGTLFFITVPAGSRLYGEHDRRLRHFRRYDRSDFRGLLKESKLEILELRSFFSALYPVRQLELLCGRTGGDVGAGAVSPPLLNAALRTVLYMPP